jgi:lysophospholipase L1-like esterase
MIRNLSLAVYCLVFTISSFAQTYKSIDPSKLDINMLEGNAFFPGGAGFYNRLPRDAESKVRKDVWNLSQHTAGLKLRFKSNATEIIVRYVVTGGMQMPHMPATGVSGIDLYAKDIHGNWLWSGGSYSFGDTITYKFSGLLSGDGVHQKGREYHLYLPLYNTVKWMEIKVPEESFFMPVQHTQEKPIVVYGTSIAQGGCASRPGMAWPAILNRKMDRPLINLGFSGNGRLEKEVLNYIGMIDAKIFILDCLPNLTGVDSTEVKLKVENAVKQLQTAKAGVPILLVEHCSFTDEALSRAKKKQYIIANAAMNAAFKSLESSGIKNIFLLTQKELGLNIESMVDGIHPNDLGMMQYAEAYAKKLKLILSEPDGNVSTTIPVTQYRDAAVYDWNVRHEEILALRKNQPVTVLMGNSITHFWGGEPASSRRAGPVSWDKYFAALPAVNLGYGWDRIENVLWRVYHGELDNIEAKNIVINIGTNNLSVNNTDEEVLKGLNHLIKAIQFRQPKAKILLLGIYPRRGMEKRIEMINRKINSLAGAMIIGYNNPGIKLLQADGKIDESLFSDGLHPNEKGYELLGKSISEALMNLK